MGINHRFKFLFYISTALIWVSCSKVTGPAALFKKFSPHDNYGQHLKDAGLEHSALGSKWLNAGDESLSTALHIVIPYKEIGYFAAEKTQTVSLRFEAKRGELIHVFLTKRPAANFKIFIDLFQENNNAYKLVSSADTAGSKLNFEITTTGTYLLRLQPELLSSGEYTLTIISGPSLGFPVAPSGKPHIESYFGDSRDEGGRRHEGIDIFAPKGTPALAAAAGTVTGVSENKLGGLVVFLRPNDRDYLLYYAHLQVQLVKEGQSVLTGDTVGLIDNTGNAKNTPTHLHFGIYTGSGAIDPLPFVKREEKEPHAINAPLDLLNLTVRTKLKSDLYASAEKKASILTSLPLHTALTVEAATDDSYKVSLPNRKIGYVKSNLVTRINSLRSITLKTNEPLFDAPDSSTAARKTVIAAGSKIEILAAFNQYYLVSHGGETGWLFY